MATPVNISDLSVPHGGYNAADRLRLALYGYTAERPLNATVTPAPTRYAVSIDDLPYRPHGSVMDPDRIRYSTFGLRFPVLVPASGTARASARSGGTDLVWIGYVDRSAARVGTASASTDRIVIFAPTTASAARTGIRSIGTDSVVTVLRSASAAIMGMVPGGIDRVIYATMIDGSPARAGARAGTSSEGVVNTIPNASAARVGVRPSTVLEWITATFVDSSAARTGIRSISTEHTNIAMMSSTARAGIRNSTAAEVLLSIVTDISAARMAARTIGTDSLVIAPVVSRAAVGVRPRGTDSLPMVDTGISRAAARAASAAILTIVSGSGHAVSIGLSARTVEHISLGIVDASAIVAGIRVGGTETIVAITPPDDGAVTTDIQWYITGDGVTIRVTDERI